MRTIENKNVIADLIRNLLQITYLGKRLRVKPAMTNTVGAYPCGRPEMTIDPCGRPRSRRFVIGVIIQRHGLQNRPSE